MIYSFRQISNMAKLIPLLVVIFGFIHTATATALTVKGLIAPVYTPTDKEGNLNLTIIPTYAKHLKDKGLNGISVSATAGEETTLSIKDKKRLLDAWLKAAKPLKLKVMSQVGGIPLPDAKELAKYSESVGVDAIEALPELYYKPTAPEELVYYLKCIASAAPNTPLLYTHLPALTEVSVDMSKFFELATKDIPNFKGIVLGDFETALLLRTKAKDGQTLFFGNSSYIAPAAFMGFESFVVGEISVFPELIKKIIEDSQNCELDAARANQEKLLDYKNAIKSQGSFFGFPSVKETMKLVTGIDVGPARAPLLPLTEKEKKELKKSLMRLGLKLKSSADEE